MYPDCTRTLSAIRAESAINLPNCLRYQQGWCSFADFPYLSQNPSGVCLPAFSPVQKLSIHASPCILSTVPSVCHWAQLLRPKPKLLGVGRNQGYAAVRSGQIPSIKIGKRYLIPLAQLERLLQG